MFAVLKKELEVDNIHLEQIVHIEGAEAFHLLKVVRIQRNEKILFLNGRGAFFHAQVIDADKKSLYVKILNIEQKQDLRTIDVAFGMTKKEACESIIKMAVELGIKGLIPLKTEFSLSRHSVEEERFYRLVESAMIQSNNAYELSYQKLLSLDELVGDDYEQIFLFTTNEKIPLFTKTSLSSIKGNILLLIGPEGGFSVAEEDFLLANFATKIRALRIDMPIMRAPTALAFAMGMASAFRF